MELPVSFLGSQCAEAEGSPRVREELRLDLDFARALEETPRGALTVRLWGARGYGHPCTLVATAFENELVAESHDGAAFVRITFDGRAPSAEVSLTGMGRRFTFDVPVLARPRADAV